mgnify:CR=1 FL=1
MNFKRLYMKWIRSTGLSLHVIQNVYEKLYWILKKYLDRFIKFYFHIMKQSIKHSNIFMIHFCYLIVCMLFKTFTRSFTESWKSKRKISEPCSCWKWISLHYKIRIWGYCKRRYLWRCSRQKHKWYHSPYC